MSTKLVVALTAGVTIIIGFIVALAVVWVLAGTEITYAVTHRGESRMCRENLQEALNNPLLQPVINTQK